MKLFMSDIRLNFQENRASPFLQKPSDFNLSIVRFSLDTYNLPVFIPIIDFESDNPDKTIYSLSVKYNGKLYLPAPLDKGSKSWGTIVTDRRPFSCLDRIHDIKSGCVPEKLDNKLTRQK